VTGPTSGVVLQPVDGPATFATMVGEIEQLGFDHLWLTDSSLHARNCYAYLALAAAHSHQLALGTAVTNPLTRHPAITASAMATVDEISGGRAILGIGTGDRPLLALGLKPSTVSDLEEAVNGIRALWSGATVDLRAARFTLQGAHMRFPARPGIPVFISASGPRTLELAGRLGDGVIVLVGLFPEAMAWAIDHIDMGAAVASQPAQPALPALPGQPGQPGQSGAGGRPHVAVFAYGAIDDDRDVALAQARSIGAWFPQTAPVICELAGLDGELVEKVRRLYSGGEFQEAAAAAALLPDDYIRKVALAGDRSDARARIEAVLSAGAGSVHVFPLGTRRMETVRAFAECWRDVTGAR
jgi:5,10-methylenetetrahydromethanopterin reductase